MHWLFENKIYHWFLFLFATLNVCDVLCANSDDSVYSIPDNKADLIDTTLGEDSAYNLTEVTESSPAGDFTIVKYWNNNGTITPVFFNVGFNNPLGDTDGNTTFYYLWDSSGDHRILSTSTVSDHDIEAKVNNDSNVRIVANQNGAAISHSFIDANKDEQYALGGAILNDSGFKIGNITGDFISNFTDTPNESYAFGGAIYNIGAVIQNIKGHFIGNYVLSKNYSYGGAILNTNNSSISDISGDFIGNYVVSNSKSYSSYGGAIYNSASTIGNISGDFIGNYSYSDYAYGGAIHNRDNAQIESITGDFIGNYSYNPDTGSYFCMAGAIYNNASTIGDITGNFIGNYASANTNNIKGGAIYNYNGTITFREGTTFTGNYINEKGIKTYEAIHSDGNSSNESYINFNAYDTAKSIVVNDGITGGSSNKASQFISINNTTSGVDYGIVEFNGFVKNQTVSVNNGTLKLGSFVGTTISVNGTELEIPDSKASLTNIDINVKSGATLLISTELTASNYTNLTLETGAILSFDADSKITFISNSNFTLEDGISIKIDLGNIVGEVSYEFLEFADSDAMSIVYSAIKNKDNISVYANGAEHDKSLWDLTDGTSDNPYSIFLSSTIIPEPSLYAVIISVLVIAVVTYRKRK